MVQYKGLSLGAGSAQAKPDHKKRHYRVNSIVTEIKAKIGTRVRVPVIKDDMLWEDVT